MISGRKLFGLHTVHFTQVCEDVSYILTVDGRKVPYSSLDVAQRSLDYLRKQGRNVSDEISEKHTSISCGEEYW